MKIVKRNPVSGSCISALLSSCAPFAIEQPTFFFALCAASTGIVPFIVNSINGHFGRSFSHTLKEVWKALKSLTHHYSTASPILVLMMINVLASGLHVSPTVVGSACGFRFYSMSMSKEPLSRGFWHSTPARLGSLSSQGRSENLNLFSAFTLTQVINAWHSRDNSRFGLRENFKLSEGLSDDGYLFRHNGVIVVISGGRLLSKSGARCDSSSIFQQAGQSHIERRVEWFRRGLLN